MHDVEYISPIEYPPPLPPLGWRRLATTLYNMPLTT